MQQRKSHPDSFKKDAVRRVMARGSKTVTEVATVPWSSLRPGQRSPVMTTSLRRATLMS